MGEKLYTVHTRAWSGAADGDATFVKEGFCWPAFFFGPLWALWHGMWRTALVLLVLSAVVSGLAIGAGLTDAGEFALSGGLQVAIGLWANDWRRRVLARRDFLERGAVAGRRLRDAEQRYLKGAV